MTAPAGAVVGIYVDLVARVDVGHVIQTQTCMACGIVGQRCEQRVHEILWYSR